MIRANHASYCRTATLHFRNAVYQGGFDSSNQSLNKSGLAYFHQHKHLLACQMFANNLLNGHSFFIYDSQHYQFGQWRDSLPCGVTLFRLQDIVVIASYQKGTIMRGTAVIVILQSYNIGVMLELALGDNWRVRERSQVYCQQQVQKLLSKCKFHRQVSLSLLKYINQHLNTRDSEMKLRYVNGYYRFGFQRGMSIEFDEEERITSINIGDCQVEANQDRNTSPIKVGQVYRNAIASKQALFKNNVLSDPSRKYFDYFKEMLSETMIKTIVSGFIKDNNSYLQRSRQLLRHSREISVKIEKIPDKERTVLKNQGKPAKMDGSDEKRCSPILIIEPLQLFSRKKEQYLSNFLKSHEDNEDSLEKAKSKRFRQNIEGHFAQSKYLRKPVSAFLLMEKQLGLQRPLATQAKIVGANDQTPLRHKQNVSLAWQSSTSKKTKMKIFDKSPSRRTLYEFSPQADRSVLSTKSRKKIFTTKPEARPVTSFQTEAAQLQPQVNNIVNDQMPSNAIQALKFQKEKTTQKRIERTISYSPSGPVAIKIPNESNVQRKRTLTEYEEQSSSIISEDMSDFQIKINTTMQANRPCPKKMKKQNDIYKESEGRQGQREAHIGKTYGNIPYLQSPLKKGGKIDERISKPALASNGPSYPQSTYYKI